MGSLHAWAGTRLLQRPRACCCPPAQQAARRRVPEPCRAMAGNPTLMAKAEGWLQLDHDPASRAQIVGLIDNGDVAQLEELLGRRLEFGAGISSSGSTAGLGTQEAAAYGCRSRGKARKELQPSVSEPQLKQQPLQALLGFESAWALASTA